MPQTVDFGNSFALSAAMTPTPNPNEETLRWQEQERAAASRMWQPMLDTIPTLLGRLVTVASFRLPESDEYHHPKLDRVFPDGLAGEVLRESHERLFAEWLGLFPDEQEQVLNTYLESLPPASGRKLLLDASQGLVPPSVSGAVRAVFLTEFAQTLNRPPALDSRGWETEAMELCAEEYRPSLAEAAFAS
jgi:hypothetical protein